MATNRTFSSKILLNLKIYRVVQKDLLNFKISFKKMNMPTPILITTTNIITQKFFLEYISRHKWCCTAYKRLLEISVIQKLLIP